MPDLVPVRVRDCACPGTPHADDGDVVYLHPKVSLELGMVCLQAINDADGDANKVTREWFAAFVRYGVAAANYEDPVDTDAMLADFEVASIVAEAANDLYGEVLLRPLGMSLSKSSDGGPTTGSTSRTKRSRRASPA